MSIREEFKKFVLRGNVIDLAVGVVIGAAFGKIVSAFVDDIVMPAISPLMPGGDWRAATVTPLNLKVGHMLGTVLDFLIVAFVIFLVLVKFVGALQKKQTSEPAPPATKTCGECLETVPAAAKRCKFCTSALAGVLLLLALAGSAAAEGDPKFEYGKKEDVKAVAWAAQVKGGLMVSGGNSQATNGSFATIASRKAGDNKFGLDFTGAYGESRTRVFNPTGGGDPATIDSDADITRAKTVSTNNAVVRARYDRFLTEHNAVYAVGGAGRDKIAGKKLFGGGQVGYSRTIVKNTGHELVGELGYDFSYESYYTAGADAVSVHSARVMVGEIWKVSGATEVYGNVEALFNLNKEGKALDAGDAVQPSLGVGAFGDTRINAKAGLSTTLWKNLSFGFGFTFKYDENPAPLSATFGPAYRAFAEKVDVITDASLIVTLL